MPFLRQSTASQVIELGPFLDETDFVTALTALSIANSDIKLRKAGGTSHTSKNSGGATHIANGYYHATLDATDTNTVGLLDVHVNAAGALPVFDRYYVLEEAVFDALAAASALGYVANAPVNVAQIAGSSAAATNLDRSARTIVRGTVDSGASTTSIPTSALDPAAAADDQFRGRVVLFDRDTTTAELRDQGSDISASAADGTLTLSVALTDAPVSGDSFVIV